MTVCSSRQPNSFGTPILPACMAATTTTTTTFLLVLILTILTTTHSTIIFTGSITPNFTTTHFFLIDNNGEFLQSPNRTFTAAILNPEPSSTSFHLVIYHTASQTVIWTANRNTPVSILGQLQLTPTGLTITNDSSSPVWSTPTLNSTVTSLNLLESGNLVLININSNILWQSFDYPTDTIVTGQKLPVGGSLVSSNSTESLSNGDYTFTLTSGDGILTWKNVTYYTLLMDSKAVKNSNRVLSYGRVNGSGFYFFGASESDVVINVMLNPVSSDSKYRILKMSNDGQLVVLRYVGDNNNWVTDFSTPADGCRNPSRCGKLGVCSSNGCDCPSGFRKIPGTKPGCSLSNNSLSLPDSCGDDETHRRSDSPESFIYIPLGSGLKYYPVDFIDPVKNGVVLSECKAICSASCSCLAFFYGNQSGSCHLIERHFGSMVSTSYSDDISDNRVGFVKAVSSPTSSRNESSSFLNGDNSSSSDFPVIGIILLPTLGVLVMLIFAILVMSRIAKKNKMKMKLDDLDMFSTAGLPFRFDHEDIVEATLNFSTPIGSGGFGTVYKGVLRDKTVVAVKKVTSLGAKGKKEFSTEIAIIGNIHHANLLKLKGVCAHGQERFLVLEYMSRGSLDRTLFGPGPPMEWKERVEIAVGTARGLAHLHNGCEHKIIHCDVKPENILLNDNMQVKISDFGLSKLLSPEQSGLFTTMRGTRGYLAPEWLTNAGISDKTDVYSYGMVLLELIHGKKNWGQALNHDLVNTNTSIDGRHCPRSHASYFPSQALEMHEEGRYLDLVEHRLASRVTNDEVGKLVKVALCCLHEDPSLRPTMANVVAMLEGTLPVCEPRSTCLNFLRYYGRRFIESSMVVAGAEIEVSSGFMVATVDSSNTSVSSNSFSYETSQQVSGPGL